MECSLCVPSSLVLTDSVDVGRQGAQGPPMVLFNGLWSVELWEVNIRVHCNQDIGYKRLGEKTKGNLKSEIL